MILAQLLSRLAQYRRPAATTDRLVINTIARYGYTRTGALTGYWTFVNAEDDRDFVTVTETEMGMLRVERHSPVLSCSVLAHPSTFKATLRNFL